MTRLQMVFGLAVAAAPYLSLATSTMAQSIADKGYGAYQTNLYQSPGSGGSQDTTTPLPGDGAQPFSFGQAPPDDPQSGAPASTNPLDAVDPPRRSLLEEYTSRSLEPAAKIPPGYSTPLYTTTQGDPTDDTTLSSGSADGSTSRESTASSTTGDDAAAPP